MISIYNKICPELMKVVQLKNKNEVSSCIVYANEYKKLKKEVEKLNVNFYEYPFINAIGVNLTQKQIIKFAKTSVVGFISKQTKVSAQISVAKKF